MPALNSSSSAMRLDWSMSPWISPERKPARRSFWFSSRTVVLRLAKMIAVCTLSTSRRYLSASNFLRGEISTLNWAMFSLRLAARATSSCLGLDRNLSASFLIGGGMVAENSSVWRWAGSFSQMNSISGMKPMSSMRSASSITSRSQPVSRILPRSNRSIRRPGVAMSTSTPPSSALTWSPICTPPISSAILRSWFLPYFSKFSATCMASSRVGSRISERGMRARRRPLARMSIIGSTKLAVLPVPVWAMAIRSRIISTWGIASAWMGVGTV